MKKGHEVVVLEASGRHGGHVLTVQDCLSESEWITAVVYCGNEAVAHTTPGEPTWDVKKGPDVIQKQVKAMEKVEEEEKVKTKIDESILKQINNAGEFYKNLLKKMEAK
jgi:hypothetical protein